MWWAANQRRIRRKYSISDLRWGNTRVLEQLLAESPETAFACLESAARHGLPEAQTGLGQCLLDGQGCAADQELAVTWFEAAARSGYAPAMNMLGRCRERGWGCAVDVTEAAIWYRRAAEQGLDWGQYNLGNALLRGRGLPHDRKAAYRCFCAAAAQGHAKSMNLVGRFLEEGWEMPCNPAAAAEWYQKAAAGGDYRGSYNWGSWLAQRGQTAQAAAQFAAAAAVASPDLLKVMAETLKDRPDFAPAAALARHRLAAASAPAASWRGAALIRRLGTWLNHMGRRAKQEVGTERA